MENNRTSTKPTLEVSLALSGGAARGTFHLGFIEALNENNVAIKAISGSSAGALVGGAISCAIPPREILKIFKSKNFKKIFKFTWFSKGIFKIDLESRVLDKLFLFENLNQTKIPLFVCVTDLDNHKSLHVNQGDPKKLICSSCALVPIFQPIFYDNIVMADGGILDLMPVKPLTQYKYKIIGINIMTSLKPQKYTFKTLTKRMLEIITSTNLNQSIKKCDWYIAPKEISKFKMFSFKELEKGFDLGYTYGQKWCKENIKD